MKILSKVFLILTIFFSSFLNPIISGNALAQEKIRSNFNVLILPFSNSTGEEGLESISKGFADLLMTNLSAYEEIRLIDRDNFSQALKEFETQLQGFLSNQKTINIGKTLGADRIITGGIALIDSQFIVNAHVFDVATTQLLFSLKVDGNSEVANTIAKELAEKIILEIKEMKVDTNDVMIDSNPEVTLHFIRGLGYYYANLFDHAVAEFMWALSMEPNYAEARFWLGRSYYADKAYDHAQVELNRFINSFPEHQLYGEAEVFLSEMKDRE